MPSLAVAPAKITPFSDETTACQFFAGALLATQLCPPLVEIKICPAANVGSLYAPATRRWPSDEAATENQKLLGALVGCQVWPPLVEA